MINTQSSSGRHANARRKSSSARMVPEITEIDFGITQGVTSIDAPTAAIGCARPVREIEEHIQRIMTGGVGLQST